ncbi:MAG: bifunctional DNA-formamidopyrimidine glycosylase/DNA-(apurinic or apyrimidinic site) lyase [Polyangiaceae bacterium]|nr:bifunctional DNA-formamidopyrimidine glycosylase/DNA-(apurinic or apyrimidinic site) lyase [Polyangiaceae bacterium]
MPELPEVEVIRRSIEPLIVGRTIARVRTTGDSYFFLTPARLVAKGLRGRRVLAIERRGKYLVAALDDGASLLLHLGMTGQLLSSVARSPRLVRSAEKANWIAEPRVFAADEHTHLELVFADRGPRVMLRDVRKFGKCALRRPGEREPRLERLGVDALEACGPVLFAATRRRRVAIKSILLDQTVLAGVGNIYADEALFRACVRPERQACHTTEAECRNLAKAVTQILREAIGSGGSTIDDYVHPDGTDGGYSRLCRVYGREGEPCSRCGQRIRRVVIQHRSAHFCPKCQR